MAWARWTCTCFRSSRVSELHSDTQDTGCDAWLKLLDLVELAAISGATRFAPGDELGEEDWQQIVDLPSSIGRLVSVKELVLYGSNLVRIPPEIGDMESLETFDPYTSYRLHWFPYEITRCRNLGSSRVSTRALYGNYRFRHAFPRLHDNFEFAPHATPSVCSVCREPFKGRIIRRWLSLRVATDVLPLLVNACSERCLESLPAPHENYVRMPHSGGSNIEQPPREG